MWPILCTKVFPMATSATKGRLNILLPEDIIRDLKELVPARQRGRFIAETLERELRRRRLLAVLDETAGAWKDEDHPEMADGPAASVILPWRPLCAKDTRWLRTTPGIAPMT